LNYGRKKEKRGRGHERKVLKKGMRKSNRAGNRLLPSQGKGKQICPGIRAKPQALTERIRRYFAVGIMARGKEWHAT